MDKNFDKIAVCGLNCESCICYISTHENRNRLENLAKSFNRSINELECSGCRTNNVSFYCETCKMKECAYSKGIYFCNECDNYPCNIIKDFMKEAPHRTEIFKSLEYLKKYGIDKWKEKMKVDYSCNKCNTINSAYDVKCRNCNNEPGNDYIKRHFKDIKNHLSR
ncbi:MAG: DUF3795 domain-containing protein [Clostridiales bacterium]